MLSSSKKLVPTLTVSLSLLLASCDNLLLSDDDSNADSSGSTTITETNTVTNTAIITMTESVTDSTTDTITITDDVTDSITVTDTVTDSVTITDTVTDTVTGSITVTDTVTDSITITDTVTDSITITDTVTVTDSETGTDAEAEPVVALASSMLDTEDTAKMCTSRDMTQAADTSEAQYITLTSELDTTISAEGVYVISGNVTNSTIVVDVLDEDAKVQLVMDNATIINQDAPAIYVKAADKVFVTTAGTNRMEVTSAYVADGDTNLDAVIFSRDDIVLSGTGTLNILSAQGNGVSSKDDLKVTGGILTITATGDGLEANDSIRICGGDITIDTGKDGLHSENEDDLTVGYIFIGGGTLTITAVDDAIRATSVVQIDEGDVFVTTSYEGIEGTYIQINGGYVDVYSTDDGINATAKSDAYEVAIEVTGGEVHVEVGAGDTDAFDSNNNIYVTGGTIYVIGNSAFDRDGNAVFSGGTVYVNGVEVFELPGMGAGGGGRP